MSDLSGKTALVTGSVQGIGLAIAEALADAGARIAVHGLAGDAQIHEVCTRLKDLGAPEAEFFSADLRGPEQIELPFTQSPIARRTGRGSRGRS